MTKIEVTIITHGLKEEEQTDTLEARMVNQRIEDMQAEFEKNNIPTKVIKR